MNEDLEKLRARIQDLAVIQGNRRITSPSGRLQGWMIDLRKVFLDAAALRTIASYFWSRYGNEAVQIGGMEVAAIPLLTGLLLESHLAGKTVNGFIIRKGRKPTGLGNSIEGSVTDAPITIVDDVLNSSDSLEKVRVVLEQAGHRMSEAFVIIDYRSEKSLIWREKHGIKVTSLFTLDDFGLKLISDKRPPPTQKFELSWRFTSPDAWSFFMVPKSAPLLIGDSVYLGTDSGVFFSLDLASGAERWRFKAEGTHQKGIWSSAAMHEGKIYFGAYNGDIYCLDAATGAEIWREPACEWIGSSPLILPEEGILVIGLEYERPSAQGSMAAFQLTDGKKVWEYTLSVYQHGSAAYYEPDDLLICGTNDHTILALNPTTGKEVWTFPTERSVKYTPRVDATRGIVVAASFDGNIYVLKASSGSLIAKFKTNNVCYTTPLISHGRIFCGSGDRHLYVIDLEEMRQIAKIECGARIYSSPRLIDGRIAFGTNGGIYHEIDPISLNVVGVLQLPDAITNAVAARPDGKRIVIPTSMNELYCYDRI